MPIDETTPMTEDTQPEAYEAPEVEAALTDQDLAREVQYAGVGSQQGGG